MRSRPARAERMDYPPPVPVWLKTNRGMNAREHPMARHARVKREKKEVAVALHGKSKPTLPCTVVLLRMAPSSGLDDDNLVSALKSVRDAVAAWLKVDDGRREVVRYRYAQTTGPWGVRIMFEAPGPGAQFQIDV
jgi:hypothetical protein